MAHAAGMAHHVATKEYFQMQMKLRENKYTVCDFDICVVWQKLMRVKIICICPFLSD